MNHDSFMQRGFDDIAWMFFFFFFEVSGAALGRQKKMIPLPHESCLRGLLGLLSFICESKGFGGRGQWVEITKCGGD